MSGYRTCKHDVIEDTPFGATMRTALCNKCSTTFRMCIAGCPNHPVDGGAWHYMVVSE